jgi:peptide/nickel transport system substrate-binding protein
MRGTRVTALIPMAALAMTISSCGDDSRPKSDGPSRVHNTTGTGRPYDVFANGPVTIPGATDGGTITVLTDRGLDGSLDPSAASDTAAVSILSGLVTRSLTQYRYDTKSRTMALVPDLATDLGRHNDDYTAWAFDIRRGARFEDGSRVTARDVARGIRRCLHSRVFPSSPCTGNAIRAVQVRLHHELILRFDEPFPDLPYLAALPAFGPVPARTKARYGTYGRHPWATGPYQVQDYSRGHRLVLVRNDEWDTRTDPARTQYPDRYVVRAGVPEAKIEDLIVADQGAARTTLTLDTLHLDPRMLGDVTARKRLVLGPDPCTTYLIPDHRTISDPAVRRALIWAYPYRAAMRAAGLMPGLTAVPATTLVPPNVPGRTALRVLHHAGFQTSPRVARRKLVRAHAAGTPLRFSYAENRPGRQLRNALVRTLRASGFDPRPQPATAGLVDLRITTRCGAWPSGQQWLVPAYRSSSTPAVERRMRQIEHLPLDQVADAWNALDHRVLRRQQLVVPLWYGGVVMAHGSRVQGMRADSVHGMPTWSRLWVSPGP